MRKGYKSLCVPEKLHQRIKVKATAKKGLSIINYLKEITR